MTLFIVQEQVTWKQTIKKINSMSFKYITETLFGIDALVGYASSGLLLYISHLSMTEVMSQFTTISATIVGLSGGVFSMLKLREGWLKARAERKIAESKVEEIEEK